MKNVYLYVLDTLADWEIGYIAAEVNSKRFFRKDASEIAFYTVSVSEIPVKTMGGLTVTPDISLSDIKIDQDTILILPGANTWNEIKNKEIISIAKKIIEAKGLVSAICGATVALADAGLLDNVPHTSNGKGFLEMFSAAYAGKDFYQDVPACASDNIITGSATGALQWTELILKRLNVFSEDTMEYWHDYFSTGSPEKFFGLMQAVQASQQ